MHAKRIQIAHLKTVLKYATVFRCQIKTFQLAFWLSLHAEKVLMKEKTNTEKAVFVFFFSGNGICKRLFKPKILLI